MKSGLTVPARKLSVTGALVFMLPGGKPADTKPIHGLISVMLIEYVWLYRKDCVKKRAVPQRPVKPVGAGLPAVARGAAGHVSVAACGLSVRMRSVVPSFMVPTTVTV